MKYFVLKKIRYIRGHEYDMPANERCKNGFDDLATAEGAIAALQHLNHRSDMVSYVIVKEIDAKN